MKSRNSLEAIAKDFERTMQLRDSHGKLCVRCTGCNRCTFGIELNKKKAALAAKRKQQANITLASVKK